MARSRMPAAMMIVMNISVIVRWLKKFNRLMTSICEDARMITVSLNFFLLLVVMWMSGGCQLFGVL